MRAETVAAIIIGAALLGVGLYARHEKNRADKLEVQLATATAAAQACSASITELESQAKAREQAAADALAKAQKDAQRHAKRADDLLRAPAAVPGDDCASALVRAHAWLEGRQ